MCPCLATSFVPLAIQLLLFTAACFLAFFLFLCCLCVLVVFFEGGGVWLLWLGVMAGGKEEKDARIEAIASSIRVVPNFPKPGIMFQDITTLLLNPKAFRNVVELFVNRYIDKGITVVAGVEARGFIFAAPIALAIGAKFIPLRKPRKLPGEVISEKYDLEYGTDCLEMHVGAVQPEDRALVVDDLIATGGTLCAAMNLLERAGAEVVECACVIELPELKWSPVDSDQQAMMDYL
ncbi:Adenine phosphoribosyl transferase protein [Dioscorea alata]|uniref:Adenine phosphoribosyl transferase protein n=1 Tax=Dioscorea alata TaxID=55571 RepID=A0ACB7UGV5_DIOAL|nr:Adenine phosphoribosyl transferase protein [Dioscorea alata]